ncbi:MAG: DUF1501 domain-containing protein [Isosphaeraceae bacterium]|nr:DUF1501 domain-containing protein [Isosphaeraceae bacterium]
MLRVLGNPKRLCNGSTRRDLLRVGSLGALGAAIGGGLAGARARASTSDLPGFGRAKSCILLFLYGSPSQLETFDPKPTAPEGIRGTLGKAISTNVPGLDIAEGLPKMARVMDKVSLLRSVSHPYPIHGVAYALTGIPRIDVAMELNPRDQLHWPFLGSVVDYVERTKASDLPDVPRNVLLPWAFSSRRVGEVARAGPYAGFLGPAYDPIAVEFVGEGTKKAKKTLRDMVWEEPEPYRGVTPASRFRLSDAVGPDAGFVSVDRLHNRKSLLTQLEEARRDLDREAEASGIDRHRAMAHSLLASPKLRRAFSLEDEQSRDRERYGMTLFGQAALTARRLVEAGGRFISVFWDEYGLAGTGWDTHWDHFPRMKDELLPGLDETLSALIADLDERGMLDETLVLCLSEHGRTPIVTPGNGGGRDHWSRCYSALLAGGGIARGRVVGRSDKIASDPVERAVSPKDILATAYHLLGIDPETVLIDRQGRPMPLVPDGRVIPEILA